jgi:hypothetical protein
MSETNGRKKVWVTAYPNIVPAGRIIVCSGEGSSLSVAIGRAVDAVLKDDRLKHKKIVLPMKFVVTGE